MHDAVIALFADVPEERHIIADVDRRGLRNGLCAFDIAVDIVARDLNRILEVLVAEANIQRGDGNVVLLDELRAQVAGAVS